VSITRTVSGHGFATPGEGAAPIAPAPTPYLLAGSIWLAPQRKADVTAQMAADLRACNAHADRGEAIRCLMARPYAPVDIMLLVDDARAAATQAAVTEAMADPCSISGFPLLDGPLSRPAEPFTAAKVEVMAKDLVRYCAFDDERAAIRSLSGLGHGQGDIIRLVDAARARAVIIAAGQSASPRNSQPATGGAMHPSE
jgi:hypothetical protein